MAPTFRRTNIRKRKPRTLPPKPPPPDSGITAILEKVYNLDRDLKQQIREERRQEEAVEDQIDSRKHQRRLARHIAKRKRQRDHFHRRRRFVRGVIYQVKRRKERQKKEFRKTGCMTYQEILATRNRFYQSYKSRGMLNQRKEESKEAWMERLKGLEKHYFDTVLMTHASTATMREPKYLFGEPCRDNLVMPPLLSLALEPKTNTGRPKCLQCRVKGMDCSYQWDRFRRRKDLSVKACARCVRNGQRHECIEYKPPPRLKEEDSSTVPATAQASEEKMISQKLQTIPEQPSGNPDRYKGIMQQGEKKKLIPQYRTSDIDYKYPEHVRNGEEEPPELEAEVAEIVKRWKDKRAGIVVDIVGSKMMEVGPKGFAPRIPPEWLKEDDDGKMVVAVSKKPTPPRRRRRRVEVDS